VDPDKFSRDLAERINRLMADERLQKKFGGSGRKRAVEKFSWATIAAETKKMYDSLRS
jgi:starch synthase